MSHKKVQLYEYPRHSPPKAGAAPPPNPPLPKPPKAGALPAPKAGAEACPKGAGLEEPNAGALPAPNAGVLDDPNAGALEPPNAGVLEAANAGALEAPNTGALDAPNAGVLDAPKVSGPDWVAPNAGVLAAAPKAAAEPPKAGALAGAAKPLFVLTPNMPMGALDGWEAEAMAAPKAGMLPLRKPRLLPTPADGKPEDEALGAAAEAPNVKDEATAAEGGAMNEGAGGPLVVGASGVGPVPSATKGLAAPAPADGETDMLLSRLRTLPPLCKVHTCSSVYEHSQTNKAWALRCRDNCRKVLRGLRTQGARSTQDLLANFMKRQRKQAHLSLRDVQPSRVRVGRLLTVLLALLLTCICNRLSKTERRCAGLQLEGDGSQGWRLRLGCSCWRSRQGSKGEGSWRRCCR